MLVVTVPVAVGAVWMSAVDIDVNRRVIRGFARQASKVVHGPRRAHVLNVDLLGRADLAGPGPSSLFFEE